MGRLVCAGSRRFWGGVHDGRTWAQLGTLAPMADKRARIRPELVERIDAVRGDVPFERCVNRALELWLEARAADDAFDSKTDELRAATARQASRPAPAGYEVAASGERPPRPLPRTKPLPPRVLPPRYATSAEVKQAVRPL